MRLDGISRTTGSGNAKRDEVERISGRRVVAVLVDPENRMTVAEADDICDHFDEIYGPGA